MHTITNHVFLDRQVRVIDHNGKKWLTAEQVGQCLGYSEANVSKGIHYLYLRHMDEFTEQDSVDLKLTSTDGKAYSKRIFSASGCIKLGFFSNTKRSKLFRQWASEVLSDQLYQPQANTPITEYATEPTRPIEQEMRDSLAIIAQGMSVLSQGMTTLMQQNETSQKYIGLLEQNQKGHAKITRALEYQVLDLKAQRMPQASIARLLRISAGTVCDLVHEKYDFSPDAGEPHPDLPRVRAMVDRVILEDSMKRTSRLLGKSATSTANQMPLLPEYGHQG